MWKEFGDPPLDHSSSPFTLTDPVAEFNTDINPHRSRLGLLVKVKMFVMVVMDIAEDDGVSVTCHLDHPVRTTGGWRCWSRDFG